jgi:hypothetical protein
MEETLMYLTTRIEAFIAGGSSAATTMDDTYSAIFVGLKPSSIG